MKTSVAESFAGRFHDIKDGIVGRLKAPLDQAVKVSWGPVAGGHEVRAEFMEEKVAPGQKALLRAAFEDVVAEAIKHGPGTASDFETHFSHDFAPGTTSVHFKFAKKA